MALLGCGAMAMPTSKVAFVQHGVSEGDEAIMHAPSTSGPRMSPLTPQLLSSAIARVMGLDARAEVDTGLPAGDIFNRPDGNVLVFVDGLRPTGEQKIETARAGGRGRKASVQVDVLIWFLWKVLLFSATVLHTGVWRAVCCCEVPLTPQLVSLMDSGTAMLTEKAKGFQRQHVKTKLRHCVTAGGHVER